MYKDEIVDIIKQNRAYNLVFMRDAFVIYSKLFVLANNKKELRKTFLKYVRDGFKYSKNENEVLHYILKKYGKVIDNDNIDIILDELDEIFGNMFNYYDNIFDGFSSSIETKQDYRTNFTKPNFEVLDDDKKNILIKRINDVHINE